MNFFAWATKLKRLPLETAVFLLVLAVVYYGGSWLRNNNWTLHLENQANQLDLTFRASKVAHPTEAAHDPDTKVTGTQSETPRIESKTNPGTKKTSRSGQSRSKRTISRRHK